eukprot:COSAG03_NODE_1648_length_3719_cov_8.306630_5_plen_49_part_00
MLWVWLNHHCIGFELCRVMSTQEAAELNGIKMYKSWSTTTMWKALLAS